MFEMDRDAQSDDSGMFSRSSVFPPSMGKADNRVVVYLPDEMYFDLVRLSRAVGISVSGGGAWAIAEKLYGKEKVARMQQESISMWHGIGTEQAQGGK